MFSQHFLQVVLYIFHFRLFSFVGLKLSPLSDLKVDLLLENFCIMLDIEVFLVFFFALTTFTAQIAVNLYLFAIRISYFVHHFIMNFKNNFLFKLQFSNHAIEFFFMNEFFMPIAFRHQFHKFSVFNLVFFSTVAVHSNTFTVIIEHKSSSI